MAEPGSVLRMKTSLERVSPLGPRMDTHTSTLPVLSDMLYSTCSKPTTTSANFHGIMNSFMNLLPTPSYLQESHDIAKQSTITSDVQCICSNNNNNTQEAALAILPLTTRPV